VFDTSLKGTVVLVLKRVLFSDGPPPDSLVALELLEVMLSSAIFEVVLSVVITMPVVA